MKKVVPGKGFPRKEYKVRFVVECGKMKPLVYVNDGWYYMLFGELREDKDGNMFTDSRPNSELWFDDVNKVKTWPTT